MYKTETFASMFDVLTGEQFDPLVKEVLKTLLRKKARYDPLLLKRVSIYLDALKDKMEDLKKDPEVPPALFDKVALEIRAYGRILDVAVEMKNEEMEKKLEMLSNKKRAQVKKEEAFGQANITAQEEEKLKQGV